MEIGDDKKMRESSSGAGTVAIALEVVLAWPLPPCSVLLGRGRQHLKFE